MKQITMSDIVSLNGYRIPGGWIAHVPVFSADPTYTNALTEALVPEFGGMRFQAEKEAKNTVDELGSVEFVSRLRDFIKRNADTYARRWPHLISDDRTLRGFDPAELQKRFVPGAASKGRFPKAYLISALQKMASAA